ncbi:hypothetical protein BHE74_00013250 [Ensete ventricosum]|nr:hypothetical protein BHE74_00013250 [Ensete ventricosum]
MVTGGRLTNDQKKWDDHSPIRKACITREGCASGIPQISAVKRVTNWANDSSSFWLIPRRDAAVDFGRALAKKFSLNSLTSWSNQKIKEGLRQLYHTWAGPRKVAAGLGAVSVRLGAPVVFLERPTVGELTATPIGEWPQSAGFSAGNTASRPAAIVPGHRCCRGLVTPRADVAELTGWAQYFP